MSVACYCGDGDHDWFYYPPADFSKLETSRRQRCYSCRELITIGADCGKFGRDRYPASEIEERIYGEGSEVPLADVYMCEECVGLFWSITDLGFCINLERGEKMRNLVKELGDYQ